MERVMKGRNEVGTEQWREWMEEASVQWSDK